MPSQNGQSFDFSYRYKILPPPQKKRVPHFWSPLNIILNGKRPYIYQEMKSTSI